MVVCDARPLTRRAAGCNKKATTQCPTCIKLQLTPAFFCTQKHFKQAWAEHKACHAQSAGPDSQSPLVNPKYRFPWTGPLRPFVLGESVSVL